MVRDSSLFQFKHGDHVCIFYRSEDKLMDLLTPYFAEGLRKGECCFGVQKSRTIKRLFNDLRFLGVDPEDEVRRGTLVLHTDDRGYLTNGKFEPERMMEMLLNTIEDCVKRGFTGFRSAGDLSWAARGRQECNQVVGYEEMVEKCYPGKPALGFCQYHVNDFPPDILDSVLAAHKMHILESERSVHTSLVLAYNDHVAEIVATPSLANPHFDYVVQHRYSKDVVCWGTEPDFQSASRRIEDRVKPSSRMTENLARHSGVSS